MPSVGLPEILVVLVVALVVLGPERLPGAARSLGRGMAEIRKVTSGLQAEVRDTFGDLDPFGSMRDAPFRVAPTRTSPTPSPAEGTGSGRFVAPWLSDGAEQPDAPATGDVDAQAPDGPSFL